MTAVFVVSCRKLLHNDPNLHQATKKIDEKS